MDENEKTVNDPTATEVSEKERLGFLKTIKSKGSSIAKGVGKKIGDLAETLTDKWDAHQESVVLNDLFEKEATHYWEPANNNFYYGIKNLDDHTILFRQKDNILAKMILCADNQDFEILETDKKNVIEYTKDGNSQKIDCFLCEYRVKENTPVVAPITINQHSNVTVNGDSYAEINSVNQAPVQQQLLDELEHQINAYKPRFLKGKEKEEAQTLFLNFKSSVTGVKPKDQSLFDKFIKVLGVVAPTAITIATRLWAGC